MFSKAMQKVDVLSGFTFSGSVQFQQVMYAAHIAAAWADVHDGSSLSFAVFDFGAGVLRDFISKPVQEGYHSIISSKVGVVDCGEVFLDLCDNASTGGEEGFSFSIGECYEAHVRLTRRKV